MRRVLMLATAAAIAASASVSWAAVSTEEAKRISEAAKTLQEIQSVPDQAIPQELFDRANCVAVIPNLKKAAFIFGGEYGKGVVSCRTTAGTRGWTAPSFIEMEKGSWGAQFGAEQIDLVLLFMNANGVKGLLQDKIDLGAGASVAAGPVGRTARASTNAGLDAQILSYSRAQGLFAGVDLSGGVLKPDKDANTDAYGPSVTAEQILVDNRVTTPAAARPFIAALRTAVTNAAVNTGVNPRTGREYGSTRNSYADNSFIVPNTWAITGFVGPGFGGGLSGSALSLGGGAEYNFTSRLGVEGEIGYARASTSTLLDLNSNTETFSGNAIYHFPRGNWAPYATFGLELLHGSQALNLNSTTAGDNGIIVTQPLNLSNSDTTFGFNLGGGFKARMSDRLRFRGDLRFFEGGSLPNFWRAYAGLTWVTGM